ncbi:DUF2971 domain-containing protein [Fluviicola taffensis]|uniref:DUF2971 domain-containing protein n=1 Tax=Fluviicola taffensis (strain DSM 16823 / NCIMB 13979 / RW262) TaxID=755732 RepID=F2IF68_FLUTR|nr:DUF2971 domain-containing protein [Fluviicola taffensis]AEA43542.1 hypothetical protein Fluta_1550 [Fluviicola taffensis DSM 16823]
MKSQRVYKYRSGDDSTFERDVKTLEENCFFAPSFNLLNDPSETLIIDTFDYQLGIFTKLFRLKTENGKARIKKSYNELISKKDELGIYSLSKTFNDELLWAHYANSHKGFCIEYDMDKLIDNFSNEELYPFPVKYSRVPPQIGLNELINGNLLSIIKKISGTKSKKWKYESEVRIIRNLSGKQVYNHKALKGIYFGLNMEHSKKDQLISRFLERGVDFYQIVQRKNLYGFQAELIFRAVEDPAYLKIVPQKLTLSSPVEYKIEEKHYDVISKTGHLKIILDEEINHNSLLWLANLFKKDIFNNTDRVYMCYWIKTIEDNVCWATTDFEAEKIEINICG